MTSLLPQLTIDIGAPPPERVEELFGSQIASLRLEIGFGGGEHLLAEADAHPATGFIGCEPYINGMAKILAQLESRPRSNVRLFAGDAADLVAWLPQASLAAHRPDPSRSLAKATALEAPFRPGNDDRSLGAHARLPRRIPLCQRHRRLHGVDAHALPALFGFQLDCRAGRRLAQTVARLHDDALRPKGRARRPPRKLPDFPEAQPQRMKASGRPEFQIDGASGRSFQNFITRCAVGSARRSKLDARTLHVGRRRHAARREAQRQQRAYRRPLEPERAAEDQNRSRACRRYRSWSTLSIARPEMAASAATASSYFRSRANRTSAS